MPSSEKKNNELLVMFGLLGTIFFFFLSIIFFCLSYTKKQEAHEIVAARLIEDSEYQATLEKDYEESVKAFAKKYSSTGFIDDTWNWVSGAKEKDRKELMKKKCINSPKASDFDGYYRKPALMFILGLLSLFISCLLIYCFERKNNFWPLLILIIVGVASVVSLFVCHSYLSGSFHWYPKFQLESSDSGHGGGTMLVILIIVMAWLIGGTVYALLSRPGETAVAAATVVAGVVAYKAGKKLLSEGVGEKIKKYGIPAAGGAAAGAVIGYKLGKKKGRSEG